MKLNREDEINVFVTLLKHFGIYEPMDKYKIICPFHADKNASLQINTQKAYFYCYAGCGASGGSLELFQEFAKLSGKKINSLNAMQEIKSIVKKSNSPYIYTSNNIYNKSNLLVEQTEKEVSYREGIKLAREYYFSLPSVCWFKPSTNKGTEEEVRECIKYMKSRGFSSLALKNAEALPSLNKYYPIIFPMFENGKFRGYVMRTFDKETEQKRKYLYNKGFKRRLVLPGEYGVKQFPGRKGKEIILVEGFLDKIKANMLGIENAGAILGWKISSEQIEKLKQSGIENIICALDNDEAGNKGFSYLRLVGEMHGFQIKRLRYPKGVNDMGDLKKGTKEAERVLKQAIKF